MSRPAESLFATEARLVAAARRGDQGAFRLLVNDAAPMLERLALRLLGHRQDAEDCTQEAVLDAWRGLGRFEGRARFRTWLHRILVSRALDVIRRRRPVAEVPEALTAAVDGPAAAAEGRDLEQIVRGAIDELPPVQRATLLLRADQGLSYEEIAYVLGSTRNAVRSNLVAARKRLALKLRGTIDLEGGAS
jgi:RNA polymerase sigma-70 factor (ECF subfamily)